MKFKKIKNNTKNQIKYLDPRYILVWLLEEVQLNREKRQRKEKEKKVRKHLRKCIQ